MRIRSIATAAVEADVDQKITESGAVAMTERPGVGVEMDVEQVHSWSTTAETVFS